MNYKGKKYVTVEQHTKCKCDCKVKEEVSTDCKTVFSECLMQKSVGLGNEQWIYSVSTYSFIVFTNK
jgi:hypothetical protein